MFCPKCGEQITDIMSFCPKCGTPLVQNSTKATVVKSRTKLRFIWIIAIIPCLVAMLVLCMFLKTYFFGSTYKGLAYRITPNGIHIDRLKDESLSKVVIPKQIWGIPVTSIGLYTNSSEDYNNLKSIEIPDSVTHIDDYAFYNCNRLENIDLPDSLTHIGESAFYNCDSLESIYLPDNVTDIGEYAFDDCDNLKKIKVSNAVIHIRRFAFDDTPWFQEQLQENGYVMANNILLKGTSDNIPDNVTIIGVMAFDDCYSLKSISIPDGVTSIGDYAFYNCYNLTSISIPNSVTTIGDNAFAECRNIENIYIPNNVTTIGKGAFVGCSSLKNVKISDGVTSIGAAAFKFCDSLESIKIPNSVTDIGNSAFYDCGSLKNVIISASVQNLGYDVFNNTPWFQNQLQKKGYVIGDGILLCGTTEEIPDGVTNIGGYAFYNCDTLEHIEIPDGVTSIGMHAFEECSNLKSISVPDSVTNIKEYAFKDTPWFQEQLQEKGYAVANNIFLYYVGSLFGADMSSGSIFTNDGMFVIPDSMTTIAPYAFYFYSQLIYCVEIPDSVTYISESAFAGCDLKKVIVERGSYAEQWIKEHYSDVKIKYK